MLEPFTLPFVQRGLLEVLALAVAAGLLGTWIVLRGLAFYAHAVGTAAFPGLVLAAGLGFPALARRVRHGGGRRRGGRRARAARARRTRTALTALVLVGALALGRDPRRATSSRRRRGVDQLLFGVAAARPARTTSRWPPPRASAAALGDARRSGRAGSRTASTRRRARAGRCARRCPTRCCSRWSRSPRSRRCGSRRAAGDRAGRRAAATTRLVVDRMRAWQIATVALVVGRGRRRAVGVGAAQRAARAGDRGARRRGVRARRAACALVRARRALARRPPARSPSRSPRRVRRRGRRPTTARVRVVATTTQLADFARQVGGDRIALTRLLRPEHRPARVRAAPARRPRGRGRRRRAAQRRRRRRVDGRRRRERGRRRRRWSTPAPDAARTREAEPHWWHDPRNADARGAADPRRARAADRADARGASRGARPLTWRGCARSTPAIAPLHRARCPPAQRKLVTDHDAFGDFAARYGIDGRRRGDPVAARRRPSRRPASFARLAGVIRREHVRAVFPETSVNPRLAKAIARQTGALVELHALRRHARAGRARTARRTWDGGRTTPTRWCAASPAGSGMPIAPR